MPIYLMGVSVFFHFDSSSLYFLPSIPGTEDGWIHRCSTSYSEQYLESYQGHMGPVYSLQWSPFRSDMFLSASGDWTLRLWQEGRESSLLQFQVRRLWGRLCVCMCGVCVWGGGGLMRGCKADKEKRRRMSPLSVGRGVNPSYVLIPTKTHLL